MPDDQSDAGAGAADALGGEGVGQGDLDAALKQIEASDRTGADRTGSDRSGADRTGQGPDVPRGFTEEAEGGEKEPSDAEQASDQGWDRGRQDRDQAHANERKDLTAAVGALIQQNQRLMEQLSGQPKSSEPSDAEKARGRLQEQLEQLNEQMEELDPSSSPEAVVKAMRAQHGLLSETLGNLDGLAGRAGGDGELAKLTETVQDLSKRFQRVEAQIDRREGTSWLQETCDELDEQFAAEGGPALRAEAQQLANRLIREAGYTGDDPPTEFATRLALEKAYRQVAEKAAKGKGGKRRKSGVPTDSGKGGSSAAGPQTVPQPLDEAVEGMVREGKLRET